MAAVDQLAEVIQMLLYGGNAQQQAEANQWLSRWGNERDAWRGAVELLSRTYLPVEVGILPLFLSLYG